MGRFRDMTGTIAGRLTVRCRAPNKGRRTVWECVCEYGNTVLVDAGNLVSGHTQSCGCYMKQRASEASLKNLIGQRFGRHVVLSRGQNCGNNATWNCLCDCGTIVENVIGSHLISGDTQSCGCLRDELTSQRHLKDLTALTFGRLIHLERTSSAAGSRIVVSWLCECSCGNRIVVRAVDLVSGNTQSCGCMAKELLKKRMQGEGNPGWKGGVSAENQRARGTAEYREFRTACFRRDNYTCQCKGCEACGIGASCGKRGVMLNVDHIKPFSTHIELRYEVSNGRTLCVPCHRETETYGKWQ